MGVILNCLLYYTGISIELPEIMKYFSNSVDYYCYWKSWDDKYSTTKVDFFTSDEKLTFSIQYTPK